MMMEEGDTKSNNDTIKITYKREDFYLPEIDFASKIFINVEFI